jgi:hypothetical protein
MKTAARQIVLAILADKGRIQSPSVRKLGAVVAMPMARTSLLSIGAVRTRGDG